MIALLLACGPKAAPQVAVTPEVAPLPPAPQLPDLSRDAGMPPELNAGSRLELTTLTWSTVRFTIAADTAGLSTLDANDAAAIQRHLAADPRWRLHHRGGVLTAEQRVEDDDGWHLPANGYHSDDMRTWRVAIRFGAHGAGDPWVDSGLTSISQAGDPTIVVEGIPLTEGQDGHLATAIVIEAPELALEIFEVAPEGDRSITAASLGTVPVVLPEIAPERVTSRGYDPAWLSERHVRAGEPSADLTTSESGDAQVTGWLATTTPGWTWLRLLDAAGQPWHDERTSSWSTERIGWGEGLFFYQAIVPMSEPGATTAQIWHQADGGGVPMKLLEWPL